MKDLVKIIYSNRLLKKLIWCLQNFLTMEFYRKICNNCYWSNIYNTHHSYVKRSVILAISFVSVLFFSFFYMPTDPANSNKASYYLRIRNYLLTLKIGITDFVKGVHINILMRSKMFLDFIQSSFSGRDILVLKSSYRI
ncbi:MAG: hypothetical protein KBG21_05000 [Ignavibacteria bacterium]|jgi:hypothetical protein|nr:hypothetical protein [Ignavibacteria bacterium]